MLLIDRQQRCDEDHCHETECKTRTEIRGPKPTKIGVREIGRECN